MYKLINFTFIRIVYQNWCNKLSNYNIGKFGLAMTVTVGLQVARYNTMQQNAQTMNVNLNHVVLHRAKTEILRCVELLIDKMHTEISDLLVEVSHDVSLEFVRSS